MEARYTCVIHVSYHIHQVDSQLGYSTEALREVKSCGLSALVFLWQKGIRSCAFRYSGTRGKFYSNIFHYSKILTSEKQLDKQWRNNILLGLFELLLEHTS